MNFQKTSVAIPPAAMTTSRFFHRKGHEQNHDKIINNKIKGANIKNLKIKALKIISGTR